MDSFVKKRVEWVDNIKFICIFFVMISHLECTPDILTHFFEPFFLTAFFFVSGYVYKEQNKLYVLLGKKAKALLVPWLIFSIFNIITSQIISFNEHLSLKTELALNMLQIRGLSDRMWFIAALFVAHIPFYFFVKNFKTKVRLIISTIMLLLCYMYSQYVDGSIFPWGTNKLPWHLEYIFVINFFMILGYEYRNMWEEKSSILYNKVNGIIFGFGYIILLAIKFILDTRQVNFFAVSTLLTTVLQLIGILLCIIISKLLPYNKWISYIGMNTLIYYGLHGKVESLIETVLRKAGIYQSACINIVEGIIVGIVIVIIVLIILILPTWIINKYFPFVVGKWYKKKVD